MYEEFLEWLAFFELEDEAQTKAAKDAERKARFQKRGSGRRRQ